MVKIKQGVDVSGWHQKMWFASFVVEQVYTEYDLVAVVTSGLDGKHSEKSLHYEGKAGDWRTRQINPAILPEIQAKLKIRLGKDFDVVLEKDHFHIEYQPKGEN